MNRRYDYLIIGAGPAGCYAAARLKSAGYRTAILEKQAAGFRKVCGDGLSVGCIRKLRALGFPVHRFDDAGAVRIKRYYEVKNQSIRTQVLEDAQIAYGCPRNITDTIFQQYAMVDSGVEIFFEYPVRQVIEESGIYRIGEFQAENLVIASGVNCGITLAGKRILNTYDRPFGVTMIVRSDRTEEEPFFLFDYDRGSEHTYAWIFYIGNKRYNIGLWSRQKNKDISKYLMQFYQEQAACRIKGNLSIESRIRGSYLGIGEPSEEYSNGIARIGDAANTCDMLSGEGISGAIMSADRFVNRMLKNE